MMGFVQRNAKLSGMVMLVDQFGRCEVVDNL